jgi:hypothetical protein
VRATTRLFERSAITRPALHVDIIVADGIAMGTLLVTVPLALVIVVGIVVT